MPFTGSHPAAVLPLLRTRLVTGALVVGSMVPDVPLFVPGAGLHYGVTHSLAGIFGVDAALGLVLLVLWDGVLAAPFRFILPAVVRRRLPDRVKAGARLRGGRSLPLLYLSLVIGAVTHVGWDEFTHPDRFGTHHVGWLRAPQTLAGHTLAGEQWAQYASGVGGGTAT